MENEKRLIDANALLASKWWHSLKDDFDKTRAKIIVQSCPTVEAVEVVRCKDCKHFYNANLDRGYCKLDGEGNFPQCTWDINDFCSYGERRTDG